MYFRNRLESIMSKRFAVSDEQIKAACKSAISMSQAALSVGMSLSTFRRHALALGVYVPNQHRPGISRMQNELRVRYAYPLEEILSGKHPQTNTVHLKRRLIKEGILKEQCGRCGLPPIWNGQVLNLQLDHKDGNCRNHRLENLWLICPNCHSQTPNFAGRNLRASRSARSKVTDADLLDSYRKHGEFSSALNALNLGQGRHFYVRLANALAVEKSPSIIELAKNRKSIEQIVIHLSLPVTRYMKNAIVELIEKNNIKDRSSNVHGTVDDYRRHRSVKKALRLKLLEDRIRASRIDFSKSGWVSKLAVELGVRHQKVRSLMSQTAPDILEKAVKRKALT